MSDQNTGGFRPLPPLPPRPGAKQNQPQQPVTPPQNGSPTQPPTPPANGYQQPVAPQEQQPWNQAPQQGYAAPQNGNLPPSPQDVQNGAYYAQSLQNTGASEKKNNKLFLIIGASLAGLLLLGGIGFGAISLLTSGDKGSKQAGTPSTGGEENDSGTGVVETRAIADGTITHVDSQGIEHVYGVYEGSGWEYVESEAFASQGMAGYMDAAGTCQLLVTAMEVPTAGESDDSLFTESFLKGFLPSFGGSASDMDSMTNYDLALANGENLQMKKVTSSTSDAEAAIFSRVVTAQETVYTHVIGCQTSDQLEDALASPELAGSVALSN